MTALEKLQQTGIRRVRAGKGFIFRTARGKPVPASELPRIRKLAIPPAWTEVHVAPSATAKLQAMGKDKAGRWQYRYHPRFRERQEQRKFQKLVDFADALPRMRRRVARDIRLPGLGRDRVMACAIRVLSTCFMRPGSDEYARRHRHYGLTTIRDRHATVKGDLVTFDYPGKSGQRQHRAIRDRSVARIVRQMKELPGKELFKFLADDGAVVDVRREHLNDYIKSVMGPDFTAKDFRTWAGTLICACALARLAEDEPQVLQAAAKKKNELRKKVVEAVKETATELGNTPAVSRNSYIEPSVLSSFEKGEVLDKYFEKVEELVEHDKPALAEPEKALKELLEESVEPARQ
ncbi:MAG TPA: DNA topoisomerase IB [Myxococcaceae bacterium]|nr:DNA topoisomerase IB [Myxococcaceae bacterium]